MNTKWKSFDFGPETAIYEDPSPHTCGSKTTALKHTIKDLVQSTKIGNIQQILAPKCIADLAVHHKKIQEVEGWLKFSFFNQSHKKVTPFLLLSGPTGSAKTTTVQVVCEYLGATFSEWINPVDIDYELLKGPNQMSKFLDFFCESKYKSLFASDNSTNKVILVKDYPNVFIRNPTEFHSTLEDIYYKGTFPVVFICTDTCNNELNIQRTLFPEDVLLKYGITTYSFNSCAPTLLKKSLKRAQDLILEHPDLFQIPSNAIIDAILASSMGDIRSAMNQFYLACLKGCGNLPTHIIVKTNLEKSGMKRKRNQGTVTLKNMVRDEALGLFHGLGRVLNPKRIEKDASWRISCDIQGLVDEFSVQPTKFALFLFENYLRYFGKKKDAAKSAEIISQSAQLMENWDHPDTLVMSLWMCVLGVLVFNEHKVSKWNQIRGPPKTSKTMSTSLREHSTLEPTDRFYYNLITKSNNFHKFSEK